MKLPYTLLLISTLILKACLIIFIILFAGIGLSPDEAQYWTWSQHLDFGYYSKPPAIAWQIFFGTSIFGSTEFGVRFGALILGTLFPLSVYWLALQSHLDKNKAFVAGLIAAFSPLGFFATFLAITDGGMILFWTLALSFIVSAIQKKQAPNYILVGFLIGCGALFKWPIYILWGLILVALLFFPYLRKQSIIFGFFVSLLGLIPTVYWNYSHDWVTFKHVSTIVQGGNDGGAHGNPLEFIGSQIALLSPLIFVFFIPALGRFKTASDSIKFLGASSFFLFLLLFIYSLFNKAQGNWGLYIYPGAIVYLMSQFGNTSIENRWIKGGIFLSIVLSIFAFTIPELNKKGILPWSINPFRHNLGWHELTKWFEENPKKQFLVADKYQATSILSFYNPVHDQAYFMNVLGIRQNQFSFWPIPTAYKNESAYFVFFENEPRMQEKIQNGIELYMRKLSEYFLEVDAPIEVPLFKVDEKIVKKAIIFKCSGFLGKMPSNPEKY